MRTGTIALVAAFALGSAASIAHAEQTWSGYYAGLETGMVYNVVTLTGDFPAPFVEPQSDTGLTFGAFAGFDRQVGNWVFGGLADVDYVGTDDLVFGGKVDTSYDMDLVATARVRAGFAANEKLLIFGTGGLAVAVANARFGGTQLASTQLGYVVGAGAEYRMKGNWSVKGEFLHHNFGDRIAPDPNNYTFKPVLNSFKVGLAYRF